MTATLHSVKMAACLQQDGDSSDPDNSGPSSLSQFLKQQPSGIQVALNSSDTSEAIKLKGDKVKLQYAIVFVGDCMEGRLDSKYRGNTFHAWVDNLCF